MSNVNKNVFERYRARLTIESITGKTFQIYVSLKDKVIELKRKIEYSEGISVAQQHLIWQSLELQDDVTLEDYKIQDGAKLKLIPAMRGGPINLLRVQIQDQLPRDVLKMLSDAEIDKAAAGKRPVTVVVVQEGEMLNFFRFVDSDMSFDTISWASAFDIEEEEAEDEEEEEVKREEDERMRQKVYALRKRMDSVDKTRIDLPKPIPPTLSHQNSIKKTHSTPVVKPAIPSAGKKTQTMPKRPALTRTDLLSSQLSTGTSAVLLSSGSSQISKRSSTLPRQSTGGTDSSQISLHRASHVLLYDGQRKSSQNSNRTAVLPFPVKQSFSHFGGSLPQIGSRKGNHPLRTRRFSLPGDDAITKKKLDVTASFKNNYVVPGKSEHTPLMCSSSYKALSNYLTLAETFPGYAQLNQPTRELPLKAPPGIQDSLNSVTPSEQLLSVPSDQSSKQVVRCAVCSKKTGLASTYQCRCDKVFCARHRYPEVHSCAYDYKADGRKELKESNPHIVAPKLPKI